MGLRSFFNKKNIVSLFIIFIMLSSVIGYMFGRDETQRQKYGDYKFSAENDQWVTVINDNKVYFSLLPQQVDVINVSDDIITRMQNTLEIDTTSDENDSFSESISLAQYELAKGLIPLDVYLRGGFTTNNSFAIPIIDCEDSTVNVPVIYFKKSNETKVYLEEDCVIAELRTEIDAVAVTDRLLYGIMRIIE